MEIKGKVHLFLSKVGLSEMNSEKWGMKLTAMISKIIFRKQIIKLIYFRR